MSKRFSISSLSVKIREHANPFLRENKKMIAQSIFTLFFIAIGVWFIKHEGAELVEVKKVMGSATWTWVLAGIGLTGLYILLQGLMYVFSFAAARQRVSLADSTVLFIKRNLISVFLPAGGISSLAFFTGTIESKGIKKSQIHFASSIYGFIGIVSVVVVAVPAFIYALLQGTVGSGEWYALAALLLLTAAMFYLYRSIIRKGKVYRLLLRMNPETEVFMNDLQSNKIDKKKFLYTILTSVLIEFAGIGHLYIAMKALGMDPGLFAAVMGYIVSVIFLIVSPFLRGLGAIEVSMTYVLIRFGSGNVEAIAATFLYRFFEFWLPLLAGILAFMSKLNKLLMRVLPALFLMVLGIVNIVSVLTPAISERLSELKDFLPIEVIHASDYLVLVAGLFLLVTAAFMLKGLRTAWWFAFGLTLLSFIGNITKAMDYEEATIALLVMAVLIGTHREYYIRTNPRMRNVGVQTSVLLMAATLIYGTIGFYYLHKNHFNIDFTIWQSLRFSLQNYFLIGSDELIPADAFANHFIYSINISGFVSIAFLIYTLVRKYVPQENVTDNERELACSLLKEYGCSPLDYFKVYSDKMLFFSENKKAFLSYRVTGTFAVVLESPVAASHDEMKRCIREFDLYCYQNSLKNIYYRTPQELLGVFRSLRKKTLFIGQEGTVDVASFSLEGKNRRSLRNAMYKVTAAGFKATVHTPPVKDGILQKIKSVSDEWLEDTGRSEIIFSQGMFVWDELKQQTIITVENTEEKIVAFLNIVPDYAPNEATYDLIRKTKDAPNGIMDFILLELFSYLKSQGITYLNVGFAPMSGINDPHTFHEKSMKFAYEKIRSFAHYKGLREYKEKFTPNWNNRYLIYQHDYDLINIPQILTRVIKP